MQALPSGLPGAGDTQAVPTAKLPSPGPEPARVLPAPARCYQGELSSLRQAHADDGCRGRSMFAVPMPSELTKQARQGSARRDKTACPKAGSTWVAQWETEDRCSGPRLAATITSSHAGYGATA